jgi:hypothetical protein
VQRPRAIAILEEGTVGSLGLMCAVGNVPGVFVECNDRHDSSRSVDPCSTETYNPAEIALELQVLQS